MKTDDLLAALREDCATSLTVTQDGDGFVVGLPVHLPTGDPYTVRLVPTGGGAWVLGDDGDTIWNLESDDVTFTEARRRHLSIAAQARGFDLIDDQIVRTVPEPSWSTILDLISLISLATKSYAELSTGADQQYRTQIRKVLADHIDGDRWRVDQAGWSPAALDDVGAYASDLSIHRVLNSTQVDVPELVGFTIGRGTPPADVAYRGRWHREHVQGVDRFVVVQDLSELKGRNVSYVRDEFGDAVLEQPGGAEPLSLDVRDFLTSHGVPVAA